jgi:hypothetical protein
MIRVAMSQGFCDELFRQTLFMIFSAGDRRHSSQI